MKTRMAILVAAALVPFGISLVPPLYVILVYYYEFSYPVSTLYGAAWSASLGIVYLRADGRERRKLRWLALLAIFAFVEPAHLILLAVGIPPFLPPNFTPA